MPSTQSCSVEEAAADADAPAIAAKILARSPNLRPGAIVTAVVPLAALPPLPCFPVRLGVLGWLQRRDRDGSEQVRRVFSSGKYNGRLSGYDGALILAGRLSSGCALSLFCCAGQRCGVDP